VAAGAVAGGRGTRCCGCGRWGCRFPGPVGLAAGFDKDARGTRGLAALGFGFVEIGTVTARAQAGNPRPRMFRLTADRALVNRMGFNNAGGGRGGRPRWAVRGGARAADPGARAARSSG